MLELLHRLLDKPSRIAIGLMSGTSVDGVDAALVQVAGHGPRTRVTTLGFQTFPFPPAVRDQVFACFNGTVSDVCELNFTLGRLFAECALGLAHLSRIPIDEVDFIASHGQTVWHVPRRGEGVPSTLQIGEGAVIAERTGCLTITDFRTRDIAAGGDGAPLVPLLDQLLFATPGVRRAVVNIGGIANVTLVDGDHPENLVAFDTGPGNALIDAIARTIDPKRRCDTNGDFAADGHVDGGLLADLMSHPYFAQEPPKSTGRELFGVPFVQPWLERTPRAQLHDLIATFTAFTAQSLVNGIRDHIGSVDELVVSGGGVHNRTLMRMIHEACPVLPLRRTDDFGVGVDAKEAVAFAVLGNETLHASPGNVPLATGASHGVVLGKISLP